VNELPTILAIDDKEAIQGFAEDALREGDFDTAAASTGEEAVTLLKGRLINYRALVSGGAIWAMPQRWPQAPPALLLMTLS
jgi:CheY-like chemotaxis protein